VRVFACAAFHGVEARDRLRDDGRDLARPERTGSGEEAVLTVGVSDHECMAVIRRIRRTPAISFSPAEWLPADALDDAYFRLLPSGQTTVTAEEAAMLAAVFAEEGELPARPAGASTWSSKRDLT
jgi:hypothetical protein